jgi:hypothetical protein
LPLLVAAPRAAEAEAEEVLARVQVLPQPLLSLARRRAAEPASQAPP